MKNIIAILILSTITSTYADPGKIISWVNHKEKIFNYFIKPDLKIELSELNSGSDEYFAMLTLKTQTDFTISQEVEAMAKGYKLKNLEYLSTQNIAKLFIDGTEQSFEIEVLNTPSGASVDSTLFLTKKEFKKIKQSKDLKLNFDISVNPKISTLIKKVALPKNTCEKLAKNGSKLRYIAKEFVELEKAVAIQTQGHGNEYYKELMLKVSQNCFDYIDIKAYSFMELMNSELLPSQADTNLSIDIYKSEYKKILKNLNLDASLE